jgi:hypothetical protein
MPKASEVKLVRRNTETGRIERRPRGRQASGFEYGYLVGDEFRAGDPPRRRGKLGRPKGSGKRGPGRPKGSGRRGRPAKASGNGTGLSQIERIVREEVRQRLLAAKKAAMDAFEQALRQ